MPQLPATLVGPLVAGATRARVEGLPVAIPGELETFSGLTIEVVDALGEHLEGLASLDIVDAAEMVVELWRPLVAGERVRVYTVTSSAPDYAFDWRFGPPLTVLPLGDALEFRPNPTLTVHADQPVVWVSGAPPGHEVALLVNGMTIGTGFAGPDGWAGIAASGLAVGDSVVAAVVSGATIGATTQVPSTVTTFPAPAVVLDPTFGGQSAVRVRGCLPGARVELTVRWSITLLWFPTAEVPLVYTGIARPDGVAEISVATLFLADTAGLAISIELEARSLEPLQGDPPTVAPVLAPTLCDETPLPDRPYYFVARPNGVPGPRIRGPVNAGDQEVWLDEWLPGAPTWIFVSSGGDPLVRNARHVGTLHEVKETWGPVIVGPSGRVSLPDGVSFAATGVDEVGDSVPVWVQVAQVVGGEEVRSSSERVRDLLHWSPDGAVPPPAVRGPALSCGQAVRVGRVVPGARVVVLQDLQFAGFARAENGGSVEVRTRHLVDGALLTAVQNVGGLSSWLAPLVPVGPFHDHTPSIVEPVATGDTRVWVSGVAPGARVVIEDESGEPYGEAAASESIARVRTWRSVGAAALRARAVTCDLSLQSAPVTPIAAPLASRAVPTFEWQARPLVPGHPVSVQDPTTNGPIQVYAPDPLPTTPGGTPVVFLLHGQSNAHPVDENVFDLALDCQVVNVQSDSRFMATSTAYLGHGELGRNLAAHGMIALSVAYDSDLVASGADFGFMEGLITYLADLYGWIVEDASRLAGPAGGVALAADLFQSEDQKVGWFGYSNGGDAVLTLAGHPELAPAHAVVCWGPSTHGVAHDPALAVSAPIAIVWGTADDRMGENFNNAHLVPFDWLPRLVGPRSWYAVPNVDHFAPSSAYSGWLGTTWVYDPQRVGPSQQDSERVVAELAGAFFLAHLGGSTTHLKYARGPVLPQLAESLGVTVDFVDPGGRSVLVESFEGAPVRNELGGISVWYGPRTEVELGPASVTSAVWQEGEGPDGESVWAHVAWADLGEVAATYWVPLPTALSAAGLRVGFGCDPAATPDGVARDVLVAVWDGEHVAAVRAASFVPVRHGVPEPAYRGWELTSNLVVPFRVHLPLDGFVAVAPLLDPNAIRALGIGFTPLWPTGGAMVDDIRVLEEP